MALGPHHPEDAAVLKAIDECIKTAEDAAKRWINGEATTLYGQAYQSACRSVASELRIYKVRKETNLRLMRNGMKPLPTDVPRARVQKKADKP